MAKGYAWGDAPSSIRSLQHWLFVRVRARTCVCVMPEQAECNRLDRHIAIVTASAPLAEREACTVPVHACVRACVRACGVWQNARYLRVASIYKDFGIPFLLSILKIRLASGFRFRTVGTMRTAASHGHLSARTRGTCDAKNKIIAEKAVLVTDGMHVHRQSRRVAMHGVVVERGRTMELGACRGWS